ncbi:MAG: hypothetical protein WCC82_11305 [Nitrososphaeraceae archaeon]
MLYHQRLKVIDVVTEYLSLQIKKGFLISDIDIDAVALGLVALYDGLTVDKIIGINESQNEKAWNVTIKAILSSLK